MLRLTRVTQIAVAVLMFTLASQSKRHPRHSLTPDLPSGARMSALHYFAQHLSTIYPSPSGHLREARVRVAVGGNGSSGSITIYEARASLLYLILCRGLLGTVGRLSVGSVGVI